MADEKSTETTALIGDRPGPRAGTWLAVIERERSFRFDLPAEGEIVLGRAEDADLRLDDASVSRRHARLSVHGARISVTDLGSGNGTTVNGVKVAGERPLASRDVVGFGDVTAVLYAHAAPQRTTPTEARTLKAGERSIVIADPGTARAYALVERMAATMLPILVQGETGSGKELAALAVHHLSPRRAGPLVALNCAAMAENLIESELFGHARGAYSGAQTAKLGLVETASGGTLFLDEVSELGPQAQAKLLRVLETQRLLRVGEVDERAVDVRLVAATNKDLEEEVAAKRFREDLFFRLCGAVIWLPPLRERPRELALLTHQFLDGACTRLGRPPLGLAPETVGILAGYRWPGNVRELKHVMESAAASAEPDDELLLPEHLPPRVTAKRGAPPAEPTSGFRPIEDEVRELEERRMREALAATGGNKTRAAELIGMPRRTFVEKMKGLLLKGKGGT